jgi:two-component system sensor histidine kinase QseC
MQHARSLQRTIATALVLLVVVACIAVGVATYVDAHHEIDEILDDHLAQSAALLVAQSGDELQELGARPDAQDARRVAFQVWRDGVLVARSANAPAVPLARHGGFADAQFDGRDWRVYTRAGDDAAVVQVAELHGPRNALARRAALRSVVPLALALPALLFAVWWAIRAAFAPLAALGRQVARRGSEDLSPVGATDAPEEVAPLVDAIDGLLARVSRSLEHERRLTADAAHELRTPIAGIRAQAQVARETHDDAARDRALAGVIAGCDRASRLTEQLLALARLDATAPATRSRVELAALTRDVLADVAPAALASGVELELSAPPSCQCAVDPTLWAVMVRNLLDNALRHGAAGGLVRVSLDSDRDDVVLSVADAGPGVPDDLAGRLGERFQRATDAKASGSGLGLSIVRRIAELHDGGVRFGPGIDGRGFGVTVTLPLHERSASGPPADV